MESASEITSIERLKQQMIYYNKKITDKYNRAYSASKRLVLARELINFSTLYKELFGYDSMLDWDFDERIYQDCDKLEYEEFIHLLNHANENEEFYKKLSENVINSFVESGYPLYRYYNSSMINNPRLDKQTMLNYMLSFLKSFDYDTYEMFRNKFLNCEILTMNTDPSMCGFAFCFPSINKSYMILNDLFDDNLFKYETILHEFGHIFEMQLAQDSNNGILIEKGLETPYTEIASCFFQYAFINYLKENKIYPNYVNQCLDMYYKEVLVFYSMIRVLCEFPDIEVDPDGMLDFLNTDIINYGEKIKEKLNYYELFDYEDKFQFRTPYIYGLGHLLSLYLYENYKTNPDFIDEFKKALLSYPFAGDISAFEKLGITKEELVNGNILKKVLKRQMEDIIEGE